MTTKTSSPDNSVTKVVDISEKPDLTHVDPKTGKASMVDVSQKASTIREAIAKGQVLMNKETFVKLRDNNIKKGDVLTVAQIAGIQAAKSTSQLIPLCHPLILSHISIKFEFQENGAIKSQGTVDTANATSGLTHAINIESTVRCKGETGVEMEALTATTTAALTIYDMCKAVSKTMRIHNVRVVEKQGGKSGHWKLEN
ncbi:hypothetical protein H4219_005064 [Mycoemilia scoparia]|uniref:cyclic pyranopterin monophosphate synthase n=1 Tax=Mycoemilia scoparia TaxID=417184 RepID=A0A9W8DQ19_9FUNG|nr:hypothetical protein H4219_005064 [Mycoemilia scoparia]